MSRSSVNKQTVCNLIACTGLIFSVPLVSLAGFPNISGNNLAMAQENKISLQSSLQQGLSKVMESNVTTSNTTVILVHGAWADGSGWSKVIPILEKAGHRVIAVQLALHSTADDIATVKRAVEFASGPTILVGHSYGGFVITNAAYNNPNVKGIVYIAAFAPDKGESLADFVNPASIPKGAIIPDSGGFLYLNSSQGLNFFAQDVQPSEGAIIIAAQKPFNQSIFTEKSGPPAWKQLPTWYQVSENDQAIPANVQRNFAQQMNATTISLPASHVSYISHPNEVAQLILNATESATQKSIVK